MYHRLSIHLLKAASKFWQLRIKLLSTSVQVFVVSTFLGKYQGAWLQNSSRKPPNYLQKSLYHLVLPPAVNENSYCPTFSLALCILTVLVFANSKVFLTHSCFFFSFQISYIFISRIPFFLFVDSIFLLVFLNCPHSMSLFSLKP